MQQSAHLEPGSTIDPGRILSGLTFIGFGVALWLYRQGHVDGLDVATFWPVALMLWGLSCLVARPRRRGHGGGVLFVVGAFLLLNNLGYASWPLVLVAVGGILVWRGWRDDAGTDDSRANGGPRSDAGVRHGG